ncbi:MAG: diphthine--ammonia ligase [Candidatus Omnitrophica bacterium]|nr:diphthine--ammonia ligase [Candidatus Omnitrophota bacterium]
MVPHTALLWTGGKDSTLALYEAKALGWEVAALVTFIPPAAEFLAHPLCVMKFQAEALGFPHYTFEVHEPFQAGYEEALHALKTKHGITQCITGDIAEVDGQPNWIRECSRSSGVHVWTPLWGRERRELLEKLLAHKFQIIFSCVKKPWFTMEWLGKTLDLNALEALEVLREKTGLDICGEEGEYHTLVLDGPLFRKRIRIDQYSKETKDSLMYLKIQKLSLASS